MKKSLIKVILSLGLFFCAGAQAAFYHYAIIIDGGSTGSRLHLFRYMPHYNYPIIEDIFTENTKPGLSSYASHPVDAGKSLSQLLADANSFLRKNSIDQSKVVISVMTTAGMRLLPAQTQTEIYQSVIKTIHNSTDFQIKEVGTIEGKMEGLYAWLDVNYLAKNLQNNRPTVGSIDVGGASTQIAFATHDLSQPDNTVAVTVNGVTYSVFSKSFLGLGQVEAFSTMIKSPDAYSCFPNGFHDNKISNGAFNYPVCDGIYGAILQQYHIATEMLAHPEIKFIGFSGLYYDYAFLGTLDAPNRSAASNRIRELCNQPWEQFSTARPNDSFNMGYCASSTYVTNLLYQSLNLSPTQLTITKKIDEQEIDWTLGALLYQLVH